MLRLGLCCIFRNEPIKFRRTTARYVLKHPLEQQRLHLADICRHNAESLMQALVFCSGHGIGAFRINSQILPVITHPQAGYTMADLPGGPTIIDMFKTCGRYARAHDIRLSFHPDQFILLSSPKKEVVCRALADLQYHARVADWVGADVINIHGGGAYGDKTGTLKHLAREIRNLPEVIRHRLTLENDDRVYTPRDLLPLCRDTGIPLVYDVHHHRCRPDGRSVEETTRLAIETWNREPLFHLSSPLEPGDTVMDRRHHDFIDIKDFPEAWLGIDITVDVEAKAKELAVLKLKQDLKTLETDSARERLS